MNGAHVLRDVRIFRIVLSVFCYLCRSETPAWTDGVPAGPVCGSAFGLRCPCTAGAFRRNPVPAVCRERAVFGEKFKPERHEKFIYTDIYDCYRCCTDFVLRGIEERSPVDRRPFRRHQGHPLRSPRLRAASAGGEGADLLSGRSDQMRPRHPVRPEFQIQPRRAPHARNGV